MKKTLAFGLVLALGSAWMAIASQATAPPRAQPSVPTSSLSWQSFRWHDINAGATRLERAALFVTVTIEGVPGERMMQLDTGAHYNALHGAAVADIAPALGATLEQSAKSRTPATVAGTIAGVHVTGEKFEVLPGYRAIFERGKPAPVIGTIGLPFFKSRLLVIDYPRARLAIVAAGAELPLAIERVMTFEPVERRNDKLYVRVAVDGVNQPGYFFDTGASLATLATTPEEWRRLTGRTLDDPRNVRHKLPTWNDAWLESVSAPMIGSLSIGPVRRSSPPIVTFDDPAYRLDALPGTRGLVGNALFTADHAIVIDLRRLRIGFARSADLPAS
jgi:hypothetical protein